MLLFIIIENQEMVKRVFGRGDTGNGLVCLMIAFKSDLKVRYKPPGLSKFGHSGKKVHNCTQLTIYKCKAKENWYIIYI